MVLRLVPGNPNIWCHVQSPPDTSIRQETINFFGAKVFIVVNELVYSFWFKEVLSDRLDSNKGFGSFRGVDWYMKLLH